MKRSLPAAILILCAACGHDRRPTAYEADAMLAGAHGTVSAPADVLPASMRKVIRTAELTLVVDSAAEALRAAVDAVDRLGGYVAATRQWRQNEQVRATATLRVPADELEKALEEIRKGALRVESESITGKDVSEESSDLGAQLANLQATEQELRQLLTTVRERTQKASDVLEVYDKLSRVRGDIDRIQGRIDYLKQMTAMSTIDLDLVPDALSSPIVEPGWRPVAIARTAARALVIALRAVATMLIWGVVFVLPLAAALLLLAFLGRLLWRVGRRRHE